MDNPPFRAWRRSLALSQLAAAHALGYSKRQVGALDRGTAAPDLTLRLAMAAVAAGIDPVGVA